VKLVETRSRNTCTPITNAQREARIMSAKYMSADGPVHGPPRWKVAKVSAGDIYACKQTFTKAFTQILLSDSCSLKFGPDGSRQAVYRCQGQDIDEDKKDIGRMFCIDG
ncbi:unnamed protein product, partial [Sphacelaria rigidula]